MWCKMNLKFFEPENRDFIKHFYEFFHNLYSLETSGIAIHPGKSVNSAPRYKINGAAGPDTSGRLLKCSKTGQCRCWQDFQFLRFYGEKNDFSFNNRTVATFEPSASGCLPRIMRAENLADVEGWRFPISTGGQVAAV